MSNEWKLNQCYEHKIKIAIEKIFFKTIGHKLILIVSKMSHKQMLSGKHFQSSIVTITLQLGTSEKALVSIATKIYHLKHPN